MRYLTLFLLCTTVAIAQKRKLTIVTWNIQYFGKTKNAKEMNAIAEIVKHADIIAIQEVVTGYGGRQAVARLKKVLESKGESWDYLLSDKTNSSEYMTERYAIIWKNEHIKIKRGKEGTLVKELDENVDREPFIVQFYVDDTSFFVMNYHAKSYLKDPREEIKYVLDYVQENYKDSKFILAGDFNLSQDEVVFDNFKQAGFKPTHLIEKTTLKRNCEQNSYLSCSVDNIFFSAKINAVSQQVIDFVKACENLKTSRYISDHLPVELQFTF
ncbi:endonuclease/exonuclease/phosphatase family protein [Kordia sp.]|uniref:endonuclease/exonuclease/phosphatase family protein n=1 Tax=Kordia sp. TaxID=1965332 RepID=UPI003D6BBDC6